MGSFMHLLYMYSLHKKIILVSPEECQGRSGYSLSTFKGSNGYKMAKDWVAAGLAYSQHITY